MMLTISFETKKEKKKNCEMKIDAVEIYMNIMICESICHRDGKLHRMLLINVG